MNLTVEDAKTILGFASVVGIPFAVSWISKVTWPDWLKFALAAGLSIVVGYLTAYTAGQILLGGSLIQNASVVFTAAQIVYYAAFRGLGLEKVLFPQTALAHHAEEKASEEVAKINVSNEAAKAILDPKAAPALDVKVQEV